VATLGLNEAEREAVAKLDREVIQPSMTNLVLLDFWAEWCGPCKQLSPVLEKIAADYADKGVRLVKIDVDADKVIAAQFRVQSIPTVYAFYQGQPVADLTNYRSEGQLTKALDQLIAQLGVGGDAGPPQADTGPLIAMAEEVLASGDAARAANVFAQVRELAPEDPAAAGGVSGGAERFSGRERIDSGIPDECMEVRPPRLPRIDDGVVESKGRNAANDTESTGGARHRPFRRRPDPELRTAGVERPDTGGVRREPEIHRRRRRPGRGDLLGHGVGRDGHGGKGKDSGSHVGS